MAGSSDSRITKIGEGLLGYVFTLEFMLEKLMAAYEKANKLAEELAENYEGQALEEMELFLLALTAQTGKSIQLYQKIKSYITWTYTSFYHNDELMYNYMEKMGMIE